MFSIVSIIVDYFSIYKLANAIGFPENDLSFVIFITDLSFIMFVHDLSFIMFIHLQLL
jgi:hypothetical protein